MSWCCALPNTKRQYSCFSQHRLNCWSDSCFFCGISDLLYLYCDQFVVQSIKWVAKPNDFGMVDDIVEPEWYGGELLLSLFCFLKRGLDLKILRHGFTRIFGAWEAICSQGRRLWLMLAPGRRILSLTRETPLFDWSSLNTSLNLQNPYCGSRDVAFRYLKSATVFWLRAIGRNICWGRVIKRQQTKEGVNATLGWYWVHKKLEPHSERQPFFVIHWSFLAPWMEPGFFEQLGLTSDATREQRIFISHAINWS